MGNRPTYDITTALFYRTNINRLPAEVHGSHFEHILSLPTALTCAAIMNTSRSAHTLSGLTGLRIVGTRQTFDQGAFTTTIEIQRSITVDTYVRDIGIVPKVITFPNEQLPVVATAVTKIQSQLYQEGDSEYAISVVVNRGEQGLDTMLIPASINDELLVTMRTAAMRQNTEIMQATFEAAFANNSYFPVDVIH